MNAVAPDSPFASLDTDGYALLPRVLASDECDALISTLDRADHLAARSLLDLDAIADLADRLVSHPALAALLPAGAVALQCTLFDKSRERDRSVGPHQDLVVPIADPRDLPAGWSLPTRKDGAWFAQAPAPVLERLLAIRVQLDDVPGSDGALEVIAGTHRHGRLDAARLRELAQSSARVVCAVPRGGALALRPLLVHGSRRLRADTGRRVLHLLFAPGVDHDSTQRGDST